MVVFGSREAAEGTAQTSLQKERHRHHCRRNGTDIRCQNTEFRIEKRPREATNRLAVGFSKF
jgi:hypothetical protein